MWYLLYDKKASPIVPATLFRTFLTQICINCFNIGTGQAEVSKKNKREISQAEFLACTLSTGPASGSLLRCTTMPLSHLFMKCALPLMSYRLGGLPTQLCSCYKDKGSETRIKRREGREKERQDWLLLAYLSRMGYKPNMARMMLSKSLNHCEHLTDILCLRPVKIYICV